MYIVSHKLKTKSHYPFQYGVSLTDIIFFDIETTGFSANTAFVYLIGCMYYKDNTWQLTQWLTEDITSEKALLEAFLDVLKNYKRIIHYNGTGFDIPFITKKFKFYQLSDPFSNLESFDIYKKLIPIKKILPVENLKLKSTENFMNLNRQDIFSGEDLIQMYANFLGKLKAEKLRKEQQAASLLLSYQSMTKDKEQTPVTPTAGELREIILLHNYEDVKNLLHLGDLLYFAELFKADSILWDLCDNQSVNESSNLPLTTEFNKEDNYFRIFLSCRTTIKPFILSLPVINSPKAEIDALNNYTNCITLTAKKDGFLIDIPIFEGELKHFFADYRDYFYLPMEDRAIHKSVAQYVDKEYRVKAKPSTCYVKKEGCFLPQTHCLFAPVFQNSNKDKITFFEIENPDFNNSNKRDYVRSILQHFIQSKNVTVST